MHKLQEIDLELYNTSKIAAKWMQHWLRLNLCECPSGEIHTCGIIQREEELMRLKMAISAFEKLYKID